MFKISTEIESVSKHVGDRKAVELVAKAGFDAWDFSMFEIESVNFTNWDMYEKLEEITNENYIILDLGTGGGEKVLEKFPQVKEILGTDFSEEMIKTANKNLKELKNYYLYLPTYWEKLKQLQSKTDRPFKYNKYTIFDLEEKFKLELTHQHEEKGE